MAAIWSTPVREHMSNKLVAVLPETPLSEVHAILEEHDISAVPIVDARGVLHGILSTKDLLREARIELLAPGEVARVTALPRTARDLMRTHVITVDEKAPLRAAAAKMVAHRIHRVVVMRGGVATGVFSTRDAMRALLAHRVATPLEQVMTKEVVTIDLGDTIRVAIGRLDDANVRGLVVVDGAWPIGVFTHLEALHARALPATLLETKVEGVMSYETICLDVKTPLYRVAGHAIHMRVRRVLAVEKRRLRGIASGFDLVRVMLESAPTELPMRA